MSDRELLLLAIAFVVGCGAGFLIVSRNRPSPPPHCRTTGHEMERRSGVRYRRDGTSEPLSYWACPKARPDHLPIPYDDKVDCYLWEASR